MPGHTSSQSDHGLPRPPDGRAGPRQTGTRSREQAARVPPPGGRVWGQTREPAVIEYRAQLVAQAHVAVALGKQSAGDAHRLLGNSWTDLRAEGHDAELPQDAASSRPTSTSPLGSCLSLTAPNSPAVSKLAKSPLNGASAK